MEERVGQAVTVGKAEAEKTKEAGGTQVLKLEIFRVKSELFGQQTVAGATSDSRGYLKPSRGVHLQAVWCHCLADLPPCFRGRLFVSVPGLQRVCYLLWARFFV